MASVYHVTTTGTDGGSGTLASPWSAHRGTGQVNNSLVAGDTVYWHAGTYTALQTYGNAFDVNGTAGTANLRITMKAWPGDTVTLDCSTRTVTDGVVTAGSSIITSASAAFTSADLNESVSIVGGGIGGADYAGQITQVDSATQARVTFGAVIPQTNVNPATITIGRVAHLRGANQQIVEFTQNYVTWEGFTISPYGSVFVGARTGIYLRYLTCARTGATTPAGAGGSDGSGNYNAIQSSGGATDLRIQHCTLSGVKYTTGSGSQTHHNAAAITLFDCVDAIVENNTISDCNAGIFDKRGGDGNIHRYNFIHDTVGDDGAFIIAVNGVAVSGLRVYQNLIAGHPVTAFSIQTAGATSVDDVRIYNNTVYDCLHGLSNVNASVPTSFQFYNNIQRLTSNTSAAQQRANASGPPSDYSSHHNAYSEIGDSGIEFQRPSGTDIDITAWRALPGTPDVTGTVTADPMFLVADTAPYTTATNFYLDPISPCRLVGSGGIDMGAYITGSETIGAGTLAVANAVFLMPGA